MNRIILSGTLGKDPEVFTPQNGDSTLLTMSIANDDNSEKKDGEWVKKTVWVKVKFWTKKPQPWLQRLLKGSEICLEGKFTETEAWGSGENIKSCAVFDVAHGTFPRILKHWNDVKQAEPVPQQNDDDEIPF